MIRLDRRQLIATAGFGLGGLVLPGGWAAAQVMAMARGFTHNVASGEPAADSVLLWTRYVSGGDSARVRVELAETADFKRVVAGGQSITGPWRDWTTKITVSGLSAGRIYHYRFISEDGSISPIGRTKTLPAGDVPTFSMAIFSCSNLPAGVFNAYGHAAARDDLDATVHLGDYFYEYKRGAYPANNVRWDLVAPQTEILTLADYRLRYASYRADPDLQAVHNRHAMIASWDDHESANDSWEGGAGNHDASEGDWTLRRLAAIQAYREWMPVDDLPYKSYEFGNIATFFKTETRLLARTKQQDSKKLFESSDPATAIANFKANDWRDPTITMMGSAQEDWLAHAMKTSTAAHKHWQIVGSGTIVGTNFAPPEAAGWSATDAAKRNFQNAIMLARAGLPSNFDNWGGYPAARERLLRSAQAADANLIISSGDSHNAWAYELSNAGMTAGVEFAGQAVTSTGYELSTKGTDPKAVAAAIVRSSPELKWCDTSRKGYMSLSLTPAAATNEWVFMETISSRTTATQPSQHMRVRKGASVLETI